MKNLRQQIFEYQHKIRVLEELQDLTEYVRKYYSPEVGTINQFYLKHGYVMVISLDKDEKKMVHYPIRELVFKEKYPLLFLTDSFWQLCR